MFRLERSVRLQLEQELGVLRWVAWAEQQVAQWPAADDPCSWDVQAAMAAIVSDSGAALARRDS